MQRQLGTVWQHHVKPWLQAFSFVAVGVGVVSSFMSLYVKHPAEIDVTSFNNATLQILYYLASSSQGAQQNCSLCAVMDQVHSMRLEPPSVPPPTIKQVALHTLRAASTADQGQPYSPACIAHDWVFLTSVVAADDVTIGIDIPARYQLPLPSRSHPWHHCLWGRQPP